MKKNWWLWIILFVGVALLLGILATGWNFVLVQNYRSILHLVRNFSLPAETSFPVGHTVIQMVLGTCGFILVLTLTLLLFVKLVREMKLNQFQSEFIATISHELKTPIASIELSSSLLRAGGLSPDESQSLWVSHQAELQRLRADVEALLEAARWSKQPSHSKGQAIYLENWVTQSFSHWRNLLGPNAELKRLGESAHFLIRADSKMLTLILDNLMTNAKKFSRGKPEVSLKTEIISQSNRRQRRWRISVEDQGWGFHPNDSKKIFNRFFRSKSEAPYSIPGTGLGLYLAASASRSMGLSLQATSKGPGQGASFIIEGKIPG